MSKEPDNPGNSEEFSVITRKDLLATPPPQIFSILVSAMSLLNLVRNQYKKENTKMEENYSKELSKHNDCQTHVHEFEGSTKLAEEGEDRHNHRFAGVTSQKIPFPDGHRHVVFTNTDFFENHHHEIGAISGPPIPVGDGKHVHFFNGNSTMDDGHFHEFQFNTLLESPLT